MSDKFSFDRNYQIGILGLMLQRHDFIGMAMDIIDSGYFEDRILIWYYQTMIGFYIQYGTAPSLLDLDNELLKACRQKKIKDMDVKDYVYVRNRLSERVLSEEYLIDEVVRFCRRQAGRKIYLETAPLMETADEDDWDEILERLNSVRQIGLNHLDVGIRYFEDVSARTQRRFNGDDRVVAPTGIVGWDVNSGDVTRLDQLIQGGCKAGQLGIWMGGTNMGKSIALPQMGKRSIVEGLNVIHYTLELSEQDVADRYDSSFSHVNFSALEAPHNIHAVESRIKELASKPRYAGRLVIKEFPTGTASVSTLRAHIRQLTQTGWYPDVIVVDYLDLLKPLTNYNDEYADLGSIASGLRGMAMEFKIPVWTATQTNRSGLSQEVVDIQHIGDSLKKAQIADIIIALCASHEERENNIMRLFLAKNRNGPSKRMLEIRTDYSRMLMYDADGKRPSLAATPPPPT